MLTVMLLAVLYNMRLFMCHYPEIIFNGGSVVVMSVAQLA